MLIDNIDVSVLYAVADVFFCLFPIAMKNSPACIVSNSCFHLSKCKSMYIHMLLICEIVQQWFSITF